MITPVGFPLRAMKRLRQAINDSDVRSDTSSICTALTERDTDTKTQMYALITTGLST